MIDQQRRTDATSGTFGDAIGGDFPQYPYQGGQVEAVYGPNQEFFARSMVYQDEVYLELRNLRSGTIEDWGVALRGGGAVPEWVTMPGSNLVLFDRPADVDHLHIEVLGRASNGQIISVNLQVDLRTGEILREGPVDVVGLEPNQQTAADTVDDRPTQEGLSTSMKRMAQAAASEISSLFKS